MRLTAIAAATLILAATSGTTWGANVTLEIVNNSSQTVENVAVFHLDADGEVIDDVVGGVIDPFGPGQSANAGGGPCGPSSIYVRLGNGAELIARIDTCADRTLVIRD